MSPIRCSKCGSTEHVTYGLHHRLCAACHKEKSDAIESKPRGTTELLRMAYGRARARDKYRGSPGPALTFDQVEQAWANARGKCEHCQRPIRLGMLKEHGDFDGSLAVLDRISLDKGYGSGCRFLCFDCNTEDGCWKMNGVLQRRLLEMSQQLESCRRPGLRGGADLGDLKELRKNILMVEKLEGGRSLRYRRVYNHLNATAW